MVDVHHRDAGFQARIFGNRGAFRDVFKLEIALVQIEFVRPHIGREIQIGQAVVVHVADGHTAAVVEIAVVKNIGGVVVLHPVDKVNTTVAWLYLLEKSGSVVRLGRFGTCGDTQATQQGKKWEFQNAIYDLRFRIYDLVRSDWLLWGALSVSL